MKKLLLLLLTFSLLLTVACNSSEQPTTDTTNITGTTDTTDSTESTGTTGVRDDDPPIGGPQYDDSTIFFYYETWKEKKIQSGYDARLFIPTENLSYFGDVHSVTNYNDMIFYRMYASDNPDVAYEFLTITDQYATIEDVLSATRKTWKDKYSNYAVTSRSLDWLNNLDAPMDIVEKYYQQLLYFPELNFFVGYLYTSKSDLAFIWHNEGITYILSFVLESIYQPIPNLTQFELYDYMERLLTTDTMLAELEVFKQMLTVVPTEAE